MDQDKLIKSTLATQIAGHVFSTIYDTSLDNQTLAEKTVDLTKIIVDKLYEGI